MKDRTKQHRDLKFGFILFGYISAIHKRLKYVCVCICLSFYNSRTNGSILMRFSINGPYGWRNNFSKIFKISRWPPFFMKKIGELREKSITSAVNVRKSWFWCLTISFKDRHSNSNKKKLIQKLNSKTIKIH